MSPVFPKDDGWYYTIYGTWFGPYASKEAAEDAYDAHTATLSGGCPTCEE